MVVRSAALVLVGLAVAACGPSAPAVEPLEQASASPLEAPADEDSAAPTADEPDATDATQDPVAAPSPSTDVGLGFESVPASSLTVPEELFPVQLSPDGRQLLVFGPHPDGVGCEESEPHALQRFDIDTREVTPALDPALGLTGAERGPGDQVLLTAGCEGTVVDVVVARETADGRFVDLVDVPMPEGRGEFFDTAGVTWAPDGTLRWVVADAAAQLVSTDTGGEEIAPRIDLDVVVYELAATSTTTYAIDFDGTQTAVVDLVTGERFPGFDDLVAQPGEDAAVFGGDAGVAVARGGTDLAVLVDDPLGDERLWSAGPVAAGDLVLSVADEFGAGELTLAGATGIVETIDVSAYAVPLPMLSEDGTRLVYSVLDAATDEILFIVRDLA